jgi:hypothetical protein
MADLADLALSEREARTELAARLDVIDARTRTPAPSPATSPAPSRGAVAGVAIPLLIFGLVVVLLVALAKRRKELAA